ncbi:glycoside hydrolase [Violaceomyces palustris]|uniref:Glycoside hydrolase n=1 Tax=Violaceomyces palustris TaxID=1673888 RepID=A0ACD0NMS2_9BASI|nr:glycoside hydrolase [Violaceomyces palustris]
MVEVPAVSPVTGNKVPEYYLHASDAFFRDTKGRAVLLRGINLSGSSKAPIGQPSQKLDGFWEKAESGGESFVGQPLNLEDGSAQVHLRRLRSWGFNCLRYVFTWEALEHEGPGKYDFEFMDYTVSVLRTVKEFGFRVFMDPHQDLFSRFTGGSGAPYWVIVACGMNARNFTVTQAAFLHAEWPSPDAPHPEEYPDMLWATNYTRLAAATLSLLFFAGRDFAPRCVIDGKNIQDWLQGYFIAACSELVKRVCDAGDLIDECVIGWDSINEPNPTYLGLEDLSVIPKKWLLKKGPVPTPLQSLRLGSGQKQVVENWAFGALGPKRAGSVTVDPQGKSIWLTEEEDQVKGGARWGWVRDEGWPLGQCLWAGHSVWDQASGELLKPDYFRRKGGPAGDQDIDFASDYWLPHWRAYAAMVRSIHKEAIVFLQPPVFEPPPTALTKDDLKERACVSCHFYDGLTLITKHWNWFNADAVGLLRGKYAGVLFAVRVGNKAIRQCMRDQLGYLRADTLNVLGNYPTLIGEIGIPFDLDNKKTYFGDSKGRGVGDYSSQTAALDASLNACDGSNVLSFALWTYCPDNSHLWGDGWNGEDLSIWGLDDIKGVSVPGTSRNRKADPNEIPSMSSVSVSSSSSISSVGNDRNSKGARPDPESQVDLPSLMNGSRAAAAFSRPYPVATVGSPASIDFDIKTSEFVFSLDASGDDFGDGSVPTIIYLPYVHYAADAIAGAASGNPCDSGRSTPSLSRSKVGSRQRTPLSMSPLEGRSMRRDSTSNSLNSTSSRETLPTGTAASKERLLASVSASLSGATCSGDSRLLPGFSEALDLDVSVSAGTWQVDGQYLSWYLAKKDAMTLSSQANQPTLKVRHTIRIKRRSGPIPFEMSASAWDLLYSSCGLL